MDTINLTIDLGKDFDGIQLENAIACCSEKRPKIILCKLLNIWVKTIGHPEWTIEVPELNEEDFRNVMFMK